MSFLKGLLAWFSIFLLIIIGYALREDLNQIYRKTMAVILPSYSWIDEKGNVMIARNSDGHFYTDALVNGVLIKFMIDTGASDIALTAKDAKNIGIDLRRLKYTRTYSTANGKTLAAPFKISNLKIADLVLNNIEAHVGQGELNISLLGMSVIKHFKKFAINDDILSISY